MNSKPVPEIIYMATFPPRECGIATFTYDLVGTFDKLFAPTVQSRVVALDSDKTGQLKYPKKVFLRIDSSSEESYRQAARKINRRAAIKLVCIQHEFGIFGGERGANLKYFLEEITKPVIITFHTVLPGPDEKLKALVNYLAQKSAGIVVMTALSKKILQDDYGINEAQIRVIPHGIHAVEFSLPEENKKSLGLSGKITVSTFGLISRGKGIEYVLESLPQVISQYPKLVYLVLGKTHPEILKQEGEAYRQFLENRVKELGLNNHVQFQNRYLKLAEILEYLRATDIYIASSLDPNQAVSGTFSYALGTGRPVIATSFAQARADIGPEVGLLVDFKNPNAYAAALLKLLEQKALREQMGKMAYFKTRYMTWQNVCLSYMKLFSGIAPELTRANIHLPPVKLAHLANLTDSFGIIQFAEFNVANPAYGYTLDDNARALAVAAQYYSLTRKPLGLKLAKIYLKFIEKSMQPDGVFQNYFDRQKQLDEEANKKVDMEEANTRALLALMRFAATEQMPEALRERACKLYNKRIQTQINFVHPRSIALFVKALYFGYKKTQSPVMLDDVREYCDQLVAFYRQNSSEGWSWFEQKLTYSNSVLCEALLLGFELTKNQEYFDVGKSSLDFLIQQTFVNNMYMSIGQNGWYDRGDKRSYFDQQPEDVAVMVQTLKTMYQITNDENYKQLMYKTFGWFLGDNVLGQFIYDCTTGGCYDGVGENNVNLNQGAESTISYLLARLALEDETKTKKC